MKYIISFTKEFFSDFFSRLTVFSKILLFVHIATWFIPIDSSVFEAKTTTVTYYLLIGYLLLTMLLCGY